MIKVIPLMLVKVPLLNQSALLLVQTTCVFLLGIVAYKVEYDTRCLQHQTRKYKNVIFYNTN